MVRASNYIIRMKTLIINKNNIYIYIYLLTLSSLISFKFYTFKIKEINCFL